MVCPVGAIYPHDQSAEVWAALNQGERHIAVQLVPSTVSAICAEFKLPPEAITVGKIISALRMLGFSHIYDDCICKDTVIREQITELTVREKNSYRLPMITCCSQSVVKFINEFYPDLVDHLYTGRSPCQIFAAMAKENYCGNTIGVSKIIHVLITQCIAAKFEIGQSEKEGIENADFALTADELARMIRIAGIELDNLAESDFDSFSAASIDKINEPDALTVNSLANARMVMDSIRKGVCDAALVKIMCCNVCSAHIECKAADCQGVKA
jgi:iron only hydrogenase large subunit-like protein